MRERLGKYSLLHKIGEGGLAQVYLALCKGDPFAVKRLKTSYSDDHRVVSDFIREVEIGMQLDHPNILKFIDQGKSGGTFFAVMEPVLGLSVKELINCAEEEGKAVPLALSLYILKETCRALHYLHQTTIYDYSSSSLFHGDLTPHNLILSNEGILKLMDFGSSAQESRLDSVKRHFGKAAYLPADVIRGGNVDPSTDIYALGITAFYLFFGSLPFENPNRYVLTEMIKNDPLPSYDASKIAANPSQEHALRLFFNVALHKEKGYRFKNAEEFLRALTRIRFKEEPISDITSVPQYYPASFSNKLKEMDRQWNEAMSHYRFEPSSISIETVNVESLLARTNRRRHPRISLEGYPFNAVLNDSEKGIKVESQIFEISRGGMLLKWEDLKTNVGQIYPVILSLGKEYAPIATDARLLYRRARNLESFAGFEFSGIGNGNIQILDDFIKGHLNDLNLGPKEKTREPRIFLDVYFPDIPSLKSEFERNISHGGMFVESDRDVNEGDSVFVRIHIPGTFRRILLKGCVILVKKEQDNSRGVALQLDLSREKIDLINDFF